MPRISISKALGFAFTFFFRNAAAIAVRVALPALMGWCAFYISLSLYLTELLKYFGNPSDRVASLALGSATAGLLVTLFSHSMIGAAVSAYALGLKDGGWRLFHVAKREWRLYAANLRLLLVVGAWIAAVQILDVMARKLSLSGRLGLALDALLIVGLALIAVRIWFLVLPASVAKPDGSILRRSWKMTAGNFWRIAAVLGALLLAGLILEIGLEFVMRTIGFIVPFPRFGTLADYATVFRVALPQVLVVVGIAYLVGHILLVGARVSVYRQLTGQMES